MADKDTLETYEALAQRWTELRRQGPVLGHSRVERPAMMRRLPDVHGKDVLCLGCGSSDECQIMLKRGAGSVTGLDASEGLLKLAREAAPEAHFVCQDLNALNLPPASFDLVFAALSLH
jgi:ubiquinone/menaquinone biosynthesis C-methylase UbiE